MTKTPRSAELRSRAASAFMASRNASNEADRHNFLTKAKGLKALAAAEEWLDDVRTIPASRPRTH